MVMNIVELSIETAELRARAEGYSFAAVKAAVKACSAANVAEATKAAMAGKTMNLRMDFAGMVAVLTSTRYRGGYQYHGDIVSPGKFQAQKWADSFEFGDAAGAAAWLHDAPECETVTVESDYRSPTVETYRKDNGEWHLVHMWDSAELERAAEPFYPGLRKDVAATIGCGMSRAFHVLFDKAVEELF